MLIFFLTIKYYQIIKLYGWEESFKNKISSIRDDEIKFLNSSAYYSMGITFAFSCTTFIVSLVSFTTYVLLDPNNVLTANKAFVTLSLLNLLRLPFALLPLAIMIGAIAKVSLNRIIKFLNSDELEEMRKEASFEGYNSEETKENSKYAIQVKDASFSWSKTSEQPVLKDINLNIEKGKLIAVVGKFLSHFLYLIT